MSQRERTRNNHSRQGALRLYAPPWCTTQLVATTIHWKLSFSESLRLKETGLMRWPPYGSLRILRFRRHWEQFPVSHKRAKQKGSKQQQQEVSHQLIQLPLCPDSRSTGGVLSHGVHSCFRHSFAQLSWEHRLPITFRLSHLAASSMKQGPVASLKG